MSILVLALGHYLLGEAWPDSIEYLVVCCNKILPRSIEAPVITCKARHAQLELNNLWSNMSLPCSFYRSVLLSRFALHGFARPRYRMMYALICFDPLMRWYRMTSTKKTSPKDPLVSSW